MHTVSPSAAAAEIAVSPAAAVAEIAASADAIAVRSEVRAKLSAILSALDASFAEREVATRLVILALLSGHHVLLLGPPGSGKSLLARAVCKAFVSATPSPDAPPTASDDARYFEYLLTRFSHPDELFGPISIPALKNEDYRRLTEGYLPRAEIAFIDEIFKASSAILNSLLGILNERVFHCGRHRETVPLLGLIGASNEPPDPEGGLGALWDRFLVRLDVAPIEAADRFLDVALGHLPKIAIAPELRLTHADVRAIRELAGTVTVPDAIRVALVAVRAGLVEAGITASDRRFRQAVDLMRIAAWTAGRDAIGLTDLMLLSHCFGEPRADDGAVRVVVRHALDEALAPMASVASDRTEHEVTSDLAAAWRGVADHQVDATSVQAAYDARFAALERFEAKLASVDAALGERRIAALGEVESSPWLVEVPARLLAVFVNAQRRIDAYRTAAQRHRDELSGLDLHGALLHRLKLAQSGPLTIALDGGIAPHPRDAEVALWLVPPGEDPDGWIPLSTEGWLLFEAAPRLAGRVQRKLLDRALAEGRPLDETVQWSATVTTLDLDEAAIFALGSDWAALMQFAGTRGIAPGSPGLAALRALSEHLRTSGMPRLPPLPEVQPPDFNR